MERRTFLQAMSAAVAATALPSAVMAQAAGLNLKITDIKLRKVRLVKELGSNPQRNPSGPAVSRVGGQTIIEIHTNQGLIGVGPGVNAQGLARGKNILVGKDPMQVDALAYELFSPEGGGAALEIALWDLVGKALNMPLYKLWGGTNNGLMPYASQHYESTPQEAADMAQTVRSTGWRAIKYHLHFKTMKEDVAFIEKVRQTMGPEFHIMVDVNQAGSYPDGWGGGWCRWDVRRALETAAEFNRLGVFFLEEPQPRWAFDDLARVTASVPMWTAGGEGSRGLHEWAWMLKTQALDVMQFEVGTIGPTVARQVCALAASYNKLAVPHVGGDLTQIAAGHLSASTKNAVRLSDEYPYGPTWEIFYQPPVADIFQMWDVFEKPLTMDKATGVVRLNELPGLGMTYKADLLSDA